MSSFKRRTTTKDNHPTLPGTRALPGPITTFITSTGVPSLDDILGGGLPLTCSLLILAPDAHSAYGELLQKYFIAQGLSCGQDVWVIDDEAKEFVEECMWVPGGGGVVQETLESTGVDDEEDDSGRDGKDEKIKIAWRYEQLKQFQTTVPSSSQTNGDFCNVFDLTTRIPPSVVESASSSGHLKFVQVTTPDTDEDDLPTTLRVLARVQELLGSPTSEGTARTPIRLCIPSLGSPQWGDLRPQDICRFLHSLRSIIRRYNHATLSISLSPHLCSDSWGGPGWTQKLGWLSDACISLSAFSGNPSLTSMFPAHHGFVHVHSLPAPHSLQPPSDKFSTLRGLSSSGENNLAFKCMRKRLVFETLHLDLEGGVGERRTTPSTTATVLDGATHDHSHEHSVLSSQGGGAVLEVKMEGLEIEAKVQPVVAEETSSVPAKKVKAKKKVAFHSDRPDLYDF
ncbi:hypothetical protein EIP91_007976 [Steccherinum ochraceum]|uniref:Elongator complex protein 4 n=1 Tax=Steccherinum ochraceum TaxID=92696 RepID=A0A4R0R3G5_9APHY|nr:hypothetical protein EIP91_007976 [Steccherinum ochraceum]